jgi:hypothetical protein
MKMFLQKLTSRKFIAALIGVATGIGLISSGGEIEGVITLLGSILSYLIVEGYIDAKALDVVDAVVEETKEKLEGDMNE